MAAIMQIPIVVPGERVSAKARDLGFKTVIVAKNANTQATLAAITKWFCDRL